MKSASLQRLTCFASVRCQQQTIPIAYKLPSAIPVPRQCRHLRPVSWFRGALRPHLTEGAASLDAGNVQAAHRSVANIDRAKKSLELCGLI
jgi:hypothetical protein